MSDPEKQNVETIERLQATIASIIRAWDDLPSGQYNPMVVESWLVNKMAPVIKVAREGAQSC
jgi:hypothetical protein